MKEDILNLLPNWPQHAYAHELLIRPSHVFLRCCNEVQNETSLTRFCAIRLRNDEDWPDLAGQLRKLFEFPSSVDHSFQALFEWLSDLSWLSEGHYALLLDLSKLDPASQNIFVALDMILKGLAEQSLQRRVRTSLVLFI